MSKIGKALSKAKQESAQEGPQLAGKILGAGLQVHMRVPSPQTQVQFPERKLQGQNRVLSSLKEPSVLDAYNLLRTQILQKTVDRNLNTIMVTSPGPEEGKTTTAMNLGLAIARNEQHTALVVDTHLRSPKLHRYLGLQCERGLTDYLLNGAPISELLITPNEEAFVVLPSGCSLQGSTDILSSQAMKRLVRELKTRYADRYIFFDCPHLLNMPDSLVFSSYVDAVLLVVEAGKTKQEEIESALGILEGKNLLGLVLNKIR